VAHAMVVSPRFSNLVKYTGIAGFCIAGLLFLTRQALFESFMVFSQSLILLMTLRGLVTRPHPPE
jgi:hypothetical protein